MKYTRYNYKKKNNDIFKFLFTLILIVFTSFLIGTAAYRVFIKGKIEKDNTNINIPKVSDDNNKGNVINKEEDFNFYGVQIGVFSKKENADNTKNKMNNKYNVFYGKENDKLRVMVGIYEEDKVKETMDGLTNEGLAPIKVTFSLKKKDFCDAEIGEILRGNLKILNKFEDKNSKPIQTKELKEWTKNLKEVEKDSRNYEVLEEIKKFTLELPDEITKDKVPVYYEAIYNVLKKVK
ncbi:SPOR domain-containing protein [Clostridium hydrogeniformans]|uniref:SPOR domain-containing protein n=1 Tax=Clostridium hydrogeniformans TaxID=349933 RepID=UPI000488D2D8|nr:SPOR domain-containing protein [Clostridium hydrogeniformans]